MDRMGGIPLNRCTQINGVVSVYKPSNRITYPFVYDIQKKIWDSFCNTHPVCTTQPVYFPKKRLLNASIGRIGHGGTLDPLAQGVLVIGLGTGTKLLHTLLNGGKLGFSTDTLDSTGKIEYQDPRTDFSHISRQYLESTLNSFIGSDIMQIPPKFSALKIHGERSCNLIRKGVPVPEFNPRPVTINSIIVEEFNLPFIKLKVDCQGGTYIRSLVRDLAGKLGTVGMVTFLERISSGPFTLSNTILDPNYFEKEDFFVIHNKFKEGGDFLKAYLGHSE